MPSPPTDWHLCSDLNCIVTAAYDWQSLIGGLTALAAAGIGGYYINKQMQLSERHEQTRLERREIAARSTLPLTLSGVSDFARQCAKELKALYDTAEITNVLGHRPSFAPVEPPSRLIEAIERMIEATGNKAITTVLSNMVSEIQVLSTRLNGLPSRIARQDHINQATQRDIEIYLVQCGVIYGYAASLFDYARFETGIVEVELEWKSVYSAFKIMQLYRAKYPGLYEVAEKREQAGKSPGARKAPTPMNVLTASS